MSAQCGGLASFLPVYQYDSVDGRVEPPGATQPDRDGNPLIFTPDAILFSANEYMRNRATTYLIHYDNTENTGTDFVLFRYEDAILMKAAAYFRKGETSEALELINELRAHRNASLLASLDEQDILDERGRELYWEGWRRQDLVRFSAFTNEWEEKAQSEDYRVIFPVPQRALDTNPKLTQITGY